VLFVALTFVAFFLFETLRRLKIHPIQYLPVAAGWRSLPAGVALEHRRSRLLRVAAAGA
jgi:hypothetical protein